MENNENIIDVEFEERNRRNLVRRERLAKTFGSGFMRVVAILYTIYVSLDLFAGFVYSTSCDTNVMLQSVSWMGLMITRFVPNILCCVSLWAIFSTAHNKHEACPLAIKSLMWVMIVLGVVTCIHFVTGTVIFIISENVILFESLNYMETVILSISLFSCLSLVKIFIYILIIIGLKGITEDKKMEKPIKLGKLLGVFLIICGGLYALNMVSIMNISDSIIESFNLEVNELFSSMLFIYENPFNPLLMGILMVFLGVVVLRFNYRKEAE